MFACRYGIVVFLLLAGLSAPLVEAAPRLSAVFGDRMVLQHGRPVKIWGWADADENIRVEFSGQQQTTKAAEDGSWSVQLQPLEPSWEAGTMSVAGSQETIAIKDILVGDVWLCGGQSNMAWTLRSTVNRDLEIASADFEAIRFLRVPLTSRGTPQHDLPPLDTRQPGRKLADLYPGLRWQLHRRRLLLCPPASSHAENPDWHRGCLLGRYDGTALGC